MKISKLYLLVLSTNLLGMHNSNKVSDIVAQREKAALLDQLYWFDKLPDDIFNKIVVPYCGGITGLAPHIFPLRIQPSKTISCCIQDNQTIRTKSTSLPYSAIPYPNHAGTKIIMMNRTWPCKAACVIDTATEKKCADLPLTHHALFSKDDSKYVTTHSHGAIVWDNAGKIITELPHCSTTTPPIFNNAGTHILTVVDQTSTDKVPHADQQKTILSLWEITTRKKLLDINCKGYIEDGYFTPDDQRIIVQSYVSLPGQDIYKREITRTCVIDIDQRKVIAQLWHPNVGQLQQRCTNNSGTKMIMCVNPKNVSGELFSSCVWQRLHMLKSVILDPKNDAVKTDHIFQHPLLYSALYPGEESMFDQPRVHFFEFNSDASKIISALDGKAYIWDSITGKCEMILHDKIDDDIVSASYSNNGLLIACKTPYNIQLYDAQNGQCLVILPHQFKKCDYDNIRTISTARFSTDVAQFITCQSTVETRHYKRIRQVVPYHQTNLWDIAFLKGTLSKKQYALLYLLNNAIERTKTFNLDEVADYSSLPKEDVHESFTSLGATLRNALIAKFKRKKRPNCIIM